MRGGAGQNFGVGIGQRLAHQHLVQNVLVGRCCLNACRFCLRRTHGGAGLDSTGAVAANLSSKGVFVFNTSNQAADDAVAQNLYNLVGTTRTSTGSYGSKAVVTFMGLKAEVKLQDTADYKVSDLEVNQAIKELDFRPNSIAQSMKNKST